jgi:L-alanine-DL-glutamate epimerase-like enolase superfamily enzyme
MKITAIRAHWLSVPIPEAQQHTPDFGRAQSFDATLVKIETDAGITGFAAARQTLLGK